MEERKSRKSRRAGSRKATAKTRKGVTLAELYLKKKKMQAIKANIVELLQILGGALALYAIIWVYCAVCFAM